MRVGRRGRSSGGCGGGHIVIRDAVFVIVEGAEVGTKMLVIVEVVWGRWVSIWVGMDALYMI